MNSCDTATAATEARQARPEEVVYVGERLAGCLGLRAAFNVIDHQLGAAFAVLDYLYTNPFQVLLVVEMNTCLHNGKRVSLIPPARRLRAPRLRISRQVEHAENLACWAVDRLLVQHKFHEIWTVVYVTGYSVKAYDFLRRCQAGITEKIDGPMWIGWNRFGVSMDGRTFWDQGRAGRIITINPMNASVLRGLNADFILDEWNLDVWGIIEPVLGAHPDNKLCIHREGAR